MVGLRYASSHAGNWGDYSDPSRKAKFLCKCSKCRTASLGNSHGKRSFWSPPALSVLERAVWWAVGANLCSQLHIWAVPVASASLGNVDVAWGRLRVSDPCRQQPPSLPPQPGSCVSGIGKLRSLWPSASPPVLGGLSSVCQCVLPTLLEPWTALSPAAAPCLRQSHPSYSRSRPSTESIRACEAARLEWSSQRDAFSTWAAGAGVSLLGCRAALQVWFWAAHIRRFLQIPWEFRELNFEERSKKLCRAELSYSQQRVARELCPERRTWVVVFRMSRGG